MSSRDLKGQFLLIQAIRNFFNEEGFLDVLTPPVVENPGMETHIHPFKLKSARGNKEHDLYLHTSPEFHMKELLSEGFEKIFTVSYCFRDEPNSPHHRSQFLMLEWYRQNSHYSKIMDDCEKLITHCFDFLKQHKLSMNEKLEKTKMVRMTIQELFDHYLKIDILRYLDKKSIRKLIEEKFSDIPLPDDASMSWDDYYFLLFLNKIEQRLEEFPSLLLHEFPHHLSALSTLKEADPRVCERFEIYLEGIELCNCFNELRDLKIQKERFANQAKEKKDLYGYSLPEPNVLYHSLEKGFPPSAGIALGVERLFLALTKTENPFWN